MPFTAEDLYGDPEPTAFARIPMDRLTRLTSCEKALRRIWDEAHSSGLLKEYEHHLDQLLAAIRKAGAKQ